MSRPTPTHRNVSGPALAAGIRHAACSPQSRWRVPVRSRDDRRGGAVIIVVLALLSLMIFLGVFFFEFVQEEQLTAGNYAANPGEGAMNPEQYLEEAEQILIIGPKANRPMCALSAGNPVEIDANGNGVADPSEDINGNGIIDGDGFYGSPHSMLAHTIGVSAPTWNGLFPTDLVPHNGHGVTFILNDADNNGIAAPWVDSNSDGDFDLGEGEYVLVDMDGDGVGDSTLYPMDTTSFSGFLNYPLFGINHSRPAQLNPRFDSFTQPVASPLRRFQPDVEYTYADVNTSFLAYDRIDPVTGRRILVPSFHRPDLFPSLRDSNVPAIQTQTNTFAGLYSLAWTRRLVLRPHLLNRYPDDTYRFLGAATPAQSGDLSRVIQPFPFQVDSNGNGIPNEQGAYSYDSSQVGINRIGQNNDLDVDADGDGRPDAIWIDGGFNLEDLPDGRQLVPLVAYYVLDGDGLLNLNVHGNMQGLYENSNPTNYDRFNAYNGPASAFYPNVPFPFSVSNTGVSPSEVNPLRVLTANPNLFTSTEKQFVFAEHQYAFGFNPAVSPVPTLALPNMEWTFLTSGRAMGRSGSRLTGRYGEENYVPQFYTGPNVSGIITSPITPPRPGVTSYNNAGVSLYDDDYDSSPENHPLGYTPPYGARYQGGASRYPTLYDPRGNSPLSGSVSVVTPYASHPTAPKGTGNATGTGTVFPSGTVVDQRVVITAATGSPVVWPLYEKGWETTLASAQIPGGAVLPTESAYTSSTLYTTLIPYEDANGNQILDAGEDLNGNGILDSGTASMIDEDDETRVRNPDRIYDDIFRPEENEKLQLSDADFRRVGGTSRLEALAPFNLKNARDAAAIRKRITTDSWDLSEHTYVPGRYNGGFTETSVWANCSLSGRTFFPPAMGAATFTATDPFRPEVRVLLATEAFNHVNSIGASRREFGTFNLLTGGASSGGASLWKQPLNLNKLLVGFDLDGYPIFRDLMPHPDMVALEYVDTSSTMGTLTIPIMIHDHNVTIPPTAKFTNIISTPTTDAQRAQTATAQEWWARYDRQRMARDIYTLLYLTSAPNGQNPVTTPGATVYPQPERIREMAQFAVNYVDALDRDDVITRFEYDNNLADGWSWSSGGPVVYGVERTSLSFSEVEFLQTKPRSNLATTLHNDDSQNVHQYLHMELRNSSPFTVYLAEGWRISRVVKGTGTRDKSVEFKSNGFGVGLPPSQDATKAKRVLPGANFLIGTHDGNVVNGAGAAICSDIYADVANGPELELILPSSPAITVSNDSQTPNPQTDLDLGVPASHPHFQYYTHVAGDGLPNSTYEDPAAAAKYLPVPTRLVRQITGTVGSPAPPETDPTKQSFDLVLERRQNLNGIEPTANTVTSSSMGDWIEVDRFQVRPADMGVAVPSNTDDAILVIADPGSQAEVRTGLTFLNSVERRQSFDPVQISHATGANSNHTMAVTSGPITSSAANAALGLSGLTQFTLWEPHFDRDFTSPYELLSVPLYGNWPLRELVSGLNTGTTASTPAGTPLPNTWYKEIHGGSQFLLAPGGNAGASGRMSGDFTAGMRFKFPNGLPGQPYGGWNPFTYQNAWYRLFDFVSVPRRADQQSEELLTGANNVSGSTKPVQRVPGKINLNTLRDETVLAALLDDETHLTYGGTYPTQDNITAARNWFGELVQSRDGTDYFANAAGFSQLGIPNSIVSRPFRGASKTDPYYTATSDLGVESGLLRSTDRRFTVPLDKRPVPTAAYTASPMLTSPTSFSTGLWAGSPPTQTDTDTHSNTSARSWQGLFDTGVVSTTVGVSTTGIDHHTRNRILAKIANNSTNKSHVFFVWTAVGYFEAHRESTNNRVQIGARLTDIPIHRRFSVVDMSRLDEAYDTTTNTFDQKKFVIFQKRLR